MEPINFIFTYPLIGIITVLFFYFLGHIRIFEFDKYSYPIHFIFWWIFFISGFATIITTFKSMLAIPFIIGIYLIGINFKKTKIDSLNLDKLVLIIFLFVVSYLFHLFNFNGFEFHKINDLHPDYVFYGRLSKWMLLNQEESIYSILKKGMSYKPYHYFDIWFNSLIVQIFNINAVISELLLKTTIGHTLVVFLFSFLLTDKKQYLLLATIPFLAPISIIHDNLPYFNKFDLHHYSLFEIRTYYKYSFLMIGILLNYFILKNKYNPVLTILISIVSIFLYPFLAPISAIVIVYKHLKKNYFLLGILICTFCSILLMIFIDANFISLKIALMIFYHILVSSSILLVIFVLPYKKNKLSSFYKNNQIIISGLFIGLIPYIIFHNTLDSVQYWSILFSCSFTLLAFKILIEQELNFTAKFILISIIIFNNIPSIYNSNTGPKIDEINSLGNLKIGYYNSMKYNSKSTFHKNFYVYTPLKEIYCFNDTLKMLYATNDTSYLNLKDFYNKQFANTKYYNFIESRKLKIEESSALIFFKNNLTDTIIYNY